MECCWVFTNSEKEIKQETLMEILVVGTQNLNTLSLDIHPDIEKSLTALTRKITILATIPKVLNSAREMEEDDDIE